MFMAKPPVLSCFFLLCDSHPTLLAYVHFDGNDVLAREQSVGTIGMAASRAYADAVPAKR